MKLFQKYSRVNLASTVIIFLLSGIAFYLVLNYTLLRQIDDDLDIEKTEILTAVRMNGSLHQPIDMKDQQIHFRPVEAAGPVGFVTLPGSDSAGTRRMLTFPVQVKGQWYEAVVIKSLEGTQTMIRIVAIITLCTILLVLLASFALNRRLLKSLWKPFYESLDVLRTYRIGEQGPLLLPSTTTDEFTMMNKTLEQAVGKASRDYTALKQFTENASHELQTPLAIIRSKIELLMQGVDLTETHSRALQGANDAIGKLSRLNNALLLLAKIGNEQFGTRKTIHLQDMIQAKIGQFRELWGERSISVESELEPVDVQMNEELADMLFNNLLSNATRHNITGGLIYIRLRPGELLIENSGLSQELDEKLLFTRFYNPSSNKESNGLGLAVIQEICQASDINITYEHEHDRHRFLLHFGQHG